MKRWRSGVTVLSAQEEAALGVSGRQGVRGPPPLPRTSWGIRGKAVPSQGSLPGQRLEEVPGGPR